MNVWGLKNCDTCRKALKWLEAEGIDHTFRDIRKDGLAADDVLAWLRIVGPVELVNRRGTTWRNLDEADKLVSTDEDLTMLILEHPAIVKRPVFVAGDTVIVGFKDEQRALIRSAVSAV